MFLSRWGQCVAAAAFLAILTIVLLPAPALHAQDPNVQPTAEPTENQVDRTGLLARQQVDELNAFRDVPFVPGELLVGFQDGDTSALQMLAGEVSAAAVEQIDLRGLDGDSGSAGIVGYVVHVPAGAEWSTMTQLLADPTVIFAVPNWLVYAADESATSSADDVMAAMPESPFSLNDPLYETQQWYLQRINASRAWSMAYADDGFEGAFVEVQVAIVDSGIDVNHPEFRGRLLSGRNYVTVGEAPDDDFGHGTHVAGLVGAAANNAAGMAGTAPKVRIDPRKVLNSVGSGSIANVATAIRDATDAGADIINLSLEACAANTVMEAAIQYAFNRGVLLIAAAGNSRCGGGSVGVAWPAAYDEVMAIAATTYNDTRASYSSTGPEVELAAPGGERNLSMISTWPGGVRCRDINAAPTQSDYCTSEGTSMAAAVVSGAAAMIKSLRPSLSAVAIRQLMVDTVYPVNEPSNFVGSGRLDLQSALRKIMPLALQFSNTNFAREVVTGTAPYTVTMRLDNLSASSLAWRADLIDGEEFIEFHNAISNTVSGAVAYGEPVYLSLTISPTNLLIGGHAGTLQVIELLPDSTRRTHFVDLSVLVRQSEDLSSYYFPLIFNNQLTGIVSSAYQWERPVEQDDRVVHFLLDSSNILLTLPFTFTMRSQTYMDARLYSDGFLRFPDATTGNPLPSRCLPDLSAPAQAIYGWWANLDPSASGARVSSFQPAADRFVVEFDDVPSASGITPAYQVSFQIVLYKSGDIRLNYQDAPGLRVDAPTVTVGVEARDGLFFNQVACKTSDVEIGYLPQSQQSLLFRGQGDIY